MLSALNQRYPHVEVIAIDDGSTDDTGAMLDRLADTHARLRVIHLARNQGKAMALRMGALAARSEYLVCIDGDAILHRDAAVYLAKQNGRNRVEFYTHGAEARRAPQGRDDADPVTPPSQGVSA